MPFPNHLWALDLCAGLFLWIWLNMIQICISQRTKGKHLDNSTAALYLFDFISCGTHSSIISHHDSVVYIYIYICKFCDSKKKEKKEINKVLLLKGMGKHYKFIFDDSYSAMVYFPRVFYSLPPVSHSLLLFGFFLWFCIFFLFWRLSTDSRDCRPMYGGAIVAYHLK